MEIGQGKSLGIRVRVGPQGCIDVQLELRHIEQAHKLLQFNLIIGGHLLVHSNLL
jgi:hypothetical protein